MCNRLSATYSKPLVRRSTITCQPLVGLGALHMKQTEYDIPKAPYGQFPPSHKKIGARFY